MEPNRNDIPLAQDPADLWDHWVHTRPDGHPLQLSGWGALKTRFGWQSGRVILPTPQGVPRAGAQVLLRRFYGLTLAYVPRGPLVDWTDAQEREELLEAMRRHCASVGASILKIEPDLPDSVANRALLHRCGFTPSPQGIQPPSTVLVDLRKDEATLLADMKSKWRYNIRLAERKGVTVRPLTRAELPTLHRLLQATGAREGFAVHSSDYYDTAFDLWVPDRATFLVAEVAGEALGAIVVAQAGPVAVYLWGASSERQRGLMPNHALQWAGMRWARNRGATRYDLWGIPDELGQLATRLSPTATLPAEVLPLHLDALPSQGLWGVYRFKQGFGGQVTRLVGAWDMPIDPIRARLYTVGLKFQKLSHSATSRAVGPITSTAGQLIAIDSPAQWHAALAHTPAPHVLQSWEWGEIKAQTGWHAERLALAGGSAAFQLLWRTPLPPLRVGYVPKGPAVDWADPDAVEAALTAVEECARQLRCVFVKIDPDVCEESPRGRRVLHALQRRCWRPSDDPIQFKNTATTDLRGGPEALLAALKSKWRYTLRLAEKRGITVRCGQPADLPECWQPTLRNRARLPGFSCCAMAPPAGISTVPAANDAGATCPIICCSGRRSAGHRDKAAPAMTGGELPPIWTHPTTACRVSGSSSRALGPLFNRTSAPGTMCSPHLPTSWSLLGNRLPSPCSTASLPSVCPGDALPKRNAAVPELASPTSLCYSRSMKKSCWLHI
ncbi:MAG: peptidoglycan bridge formation glycyltransferase FemA/FemB family protein [Caldilinea sp.]|nr:peptidoglycan bridge formation glycyltransferase FemA/FemB family protein [Caldilinea sp.]